MNLLKVGFVSTALWIVTACGGGSDSAPPPPPPPSSFTVTAAAGAGGTIAPTSVVVTSGQTTSFTVTADAGFVIANVSGCGGSLTGNTYTTAAITSACTVTASFNELDPVVETITGRVIDGYLSGATVFLDSNGNGVRDGNEPFTESGADGVFSLGLRAEASACSAYSALVAQVPVGAEDADNGTVTSAFRMVMPATLVSAASEQFISPISTLLWNEVQQQYSDSEKKALSVSCAALRADPALQAELESLLDAGFFEMRQLTAISDRAILLGDYIANANTVLSGLASRSVPALQHAEQRRAQLQQQSPEALVDVQMFPFAGAAARFWTRVELSSNDIDSDYDGAWIQRQLSHIDFDIIADDFVSIFRDDSDWTYLLIDRDFNDHVVAIEDIDESCGHADSATVQLGAQLPYGIEQVKLANGESCGGLRTPYKRLEVTLPATDSQSATTWSVELRYDLNSDSYGFLNEWGDFLSNRDQFDFRALAAAVEGYVGYYDEATSFPLQHALAATVTTEREEDGQRVVYTLEGRADYGAMVWHETRTVYAADGSSMSYCRGLGTIDFIPCDTRTHFINVITEGPGSITPTFARVYENATPSFLVDLTNADNVDISGCEGTLADGVYTTVPITQSCLLRAVFSIESVELRGRVDDLDLTFGDVWLNIPDNEYEVVLNGSEFTVRVAKRFIESHAERLRISVRGLYNRSQDITLTTNLMSLADINAGPGFPVDSDQLPGLSVSAVTTALDALLASLNDGEAVTTYDDYDSARNRVYWPRLLDRVQVYSLVTARRATASSSDMFEVLKDSLEVQTLLANSSRFALAQVGEQSFEQFIASPVEYPQSRRLLGFNTEGLVESNAYLEISSNTELLFFDAIDQWQRSRFNYTQSDFTYQLEPQAASNDPAQLRTCVVDAVQLRTDSEFLAAYPDGVPVPCYSEVVKLKPVLADTATGLTAVLKREEIVEGPLVLGDFGVVDVPALEGYRVALHQLLEFNPEVSGEVFSIADGTRMVVPDLTPRLGDSGQIVVRFNSDGTFVQEIDMLAALPDASAAMANSAELVLKRGQWQLLNSGTLLWLVDDQGNRIEMQQLSEPVASEQRRFLLVYRGAAKGGGIALRYAMPLDTGASSDALFDWTLAGDQLIKPVRAPFDSLWSALDAWLYRRAGDVTERILPYCSDPELLWPLGEQNCPVAQQFRSISFNDATAVDDSGFYMLQPLNENETLIRTVRVIYTFASTVAVVFEQELLWTHDDGTGQPRYELLNAGQISARLRQ